MKESDHESVKKYSRYHRSLCSWQTTSFSYNNCTDNYRYSQGPSELEHVFPKKMFL